MKTLDRRQFLKHSVGGLATLVVGSKLSWALGGTAFAATQTVNLHIADAIKEMHTHNAINAARCYYWIYKSVVPDLPAETPGPSIMARKGDTVNISVTNDLDEPHAFYIPGMVDSGPIAPGATWTGSFTANVSGAHLYYDNLNRPVNRMMGLYGALIVIPSAPLPGHNFTPYDSPTPGVQMLYDDFGSSAHFPGLSWEQGDPATFTPPFRHYVWLLHQASPKLFAEVGSLPPGQIYSSAEFVNKFLRGPFKVNNSSVSNDISYIPQYFQINGQTGHFAHNNCYVTPMGRVGEPAVVYLLNAGLWTHSMHLHANHMYITSVNGVVQENPIWVDVYNIEPMDRVDYTIPFMRPPDLPNTRGIGLPDPPLNTINGHPCWPPVEEMNMYIPGPGEDMAQDINGNPIDLKQRLSPLCYPMHDHSEPSQTTQGGNYNTGLISGIYFTGDRNTPGWMDFPMDEDWRLMYGTGIDRGCALDGTHACAPPAHHD
ncbi:MAG: multicopper oxidase domain-containing protein [Chloroflexi bacterium]|nr:multicopper oxidase domain-containing protein [Chloroflexota bacterium]